MKRIPRFATYGTLIALATTGGLTLITPLEIERAPRTAAYQRPKRIEETRMASLPSPAPITSIAPARAGLQSSTPQPLETLVSHTKEETRSAQQPHYDIAIETSQRQPICNIQTIIQQFNQGNYTTSAFGQDDDRLGLALYYFGRIKNVLDDINTCRTTPPQQKRSLLSSVSNEALRTVEQITNSDARLGVILHLQQQVTDEIPRAQNDASLNSLVSIRTDLITLGAHMNADQLTPNNCLAYIHQIHNLPNDAKTSWYDLFLRAKQKAINHHVRKWSGLEKGPVGGDLMDIYNVQFFRQ